jgi:hypothetical protein
VWVCGDGEGDVVGMCIPGVCVCVCGDGEGDDIGICIPGVCVCVCGDGEGDDIGICIPGVCVCVCGDGEGDTCGLLIAGCFLRVTAFLFRVTFFLFAPGLGFGLFIPGILCPSCCENTAGPDAKDRINTAAKNRCLYREIKLFIIPLYLDFGAGELLNHTQSARTNHRSLTASSPLSFSCHTSRRHNSSNRPFVNVGSFPFSRAPSLRVSSSMNHLDSNTIPLHNTIQSSCSDLSARFVQNRRRREQDQVRARGPEQIL